MTYLIENGANIKSLNRYGIENAIGNGNYDLIYYLVGKGVDLTEYITESNLTLLIIQGIEDVNNKFIKYLTANSPELVSKLSTTKVPKETHKFIEYLVTNFPDAIKNKSLITITAAAGDLELVKLFVELGQDIRAEGDLALSTACINGHFVVVKYLVEHGANPNNHFVLSTACQNGYLDIVEYLVASGAVVDKWCIHSACESGHLDIVKFLVGSSTNIELDRGCMRTAAEKGHLDVCRIFIKIWII